MGKIYAIDNFEDNNWALDTSEIDANDNDLFIGFTNKAPIISFRNLKFGYELKKNGNIIQYKTYPPAGVQYKMSDQKYIVSDRLNLEAEETYSLFLWAENDRNKIEKEFDFETPRLINTFESWSWDSNKKRWYPPIEKPDRDNIYIWDEENLSWIKVVDSDGTQS